MRLQEWRKSQRDLRHKLRNGWLELLEASRYNDEAEAMLLWIKDTIQNPYNIHSQLLFSQAVENA